MDKARQQGLLTEQKADAEYTDAEVYQWITAAGLSTKEQVTEYSGRGVGLDVVVSNLASLGGSLEIESERGRGTGMTIKIPLTYAIVDGVVTKIR